MWPGTGDSSPRPERGGYRDSPGQNVSRNPIWTLRGGRADVMVPNGVLPVRLPAGLSQIDLVERVEHVGLEL